MDDFDTSEASQENENPVEEKLSHSDKFMGIFTEPGKTFEKMSKFSPKTIDWLLPFSILLLVVIVTQFIVLNNSEIYYQVKNKQLQRIEKTMNNAVASGKMTEKQAKEQMNKIQDKINKSRTTVAKVMQAVGIIIFGFIVFFIVSGVYFLFSKFVFKGEGTYNSVLVVNGMVSYIWIIQVIIAAIISLLIGKLISDTSLASFVNVDKSSFLGFVFEKINPISIWVYIILSIGLAKMFKSSSTLKYYFMVFGLWIGWGFLVYIIVQAVPFLKFLAG
ncbi:MAG TPA: hypothetical protein ENI61_05850 [Ignavibacteria bacterium]|nr:hypothetical protein [Ignavibacteria bacterium]